MKFLILILSLSFSFSASAGDITKLAQGEAFAKFCDKAVIRHPDTDNFWWVRKARFATHKDRIFASISDQKRYYSIYEINYDSNEPVEIYVTTEKIKDIAFFDDQLWILFDETLSLFDIEARKVVFSMKTHKMSELPEKSFKAEGLARIGDKLGIAHGEIGLVVVDPKKRNIESVHGLGLAQSNGHRSRAIDIASMGEYSYIAADNVTLPMNNIFPFNGFVKFWTKGPKINSQHWMHRKRSGVLGIQARITAGTNHLVISNMDYFQFVNTEQFESKKPVLIGYRFLKTTYKNQTFNIDVLGDILFENGAVAGCGEISIVTDESPTGKKYGAPFLQQIW